jgi:hypothetical protein
MGALLSSALRGPGPNQYATALAEYDVEFNARRLNLGGWRHSFKGIRVLERVRLRISQ